MTRPSGPSRSAKLRGGEATRRAADPAMAARGWGRVISVTGAIVRQEHQRSWPGEGSAGKLVQGHRRNLCSTRRHGELCGARPPLTRGRSWSGSIRPRPPDASSSSVTSRPAASASPRSRVPHRVPRLGAGEPMSTGSPSRSMVVRCATPSDRRFLCCDDWQREA